MAQWSDQEPYDGEVVIESMGIGNIYFEVERAFDGTGYRITGGNLFGSQSIHVRNAQNVLHALGYISRRGDRPGAMSQKEIEAWPGFIRVEERAKDDKA